MHFKNRTVSILLALVMVLSLITPVRADATTGGDFGENNSLHWALTENGGMVTVVENEEYVEKTAFTLTISGTGAMPNWASMADQPWAANRLRVTKIVVADGVQSIGDCAFRMCAKATSATVASSVQGIGAYAFYYCIALKDLTLGNGVKTIGECAFASCKVLAGVTLPSNVQSIGTEAFSSCAALTGVTIPASVTSVGTAPFLGCTLLTAITVAAGSASLNGADGVLFDKNMTRLIQYPCGRTATSYVVPDGVATIGGESFKGCKTIESITIPFSVTLVEGDAFKLCDNLKTVTYGGGEANWAAINFTTGNDKLTGATITYGAYQAPSGTCGAQGSNLTWEISDDNTLTVSGTGAMADWESYYDVPWRNHLESVTSIVIGDGVTSVGSYAFEVPASLTVPRKTALTSVTIGKDVTSIGDHAFDNSYKLTSLTLGAGLKTVGRYAFADCAALTNAALPEGLTTIGYAAFMDCALLASAPIPSTVTGIGGGAFYGCKALTGVTLPAGLTTLGESAFQDCTALKGTVTIPGGVTYVGKGVFASTGITGATMQEGVKTIGESAFHDSKLASVTIPVSVTTIEPYAFYGTALAVVNYGGSQMNWSWINFEVDKETGESGNDSLRNAPKFNWGEFYAPSGDCGANLTWTLNEEGRLTVSGTGAMSDWDWKKYDYAPWTEYRGGIKSVSIASGVTSIGAYAFTLCENLTGVTIPASVTSIGDYAFCDCAALESIVLPTALRSIGEFALKDCTALKTLTIPASVTEIGDFALYCCTGLTSLAVDGGNANYSSEGNVLFNKKKTELIFCTDTKTDYTIPSSVTVIDPAAFYGCIKLTSVKVPSGVQAIDDQTFCWCTKLAHVELPANLEKIGAEAFYSCGKLAELTIPDSVTEIGEGAFYYCTALASVKLPAGITSIEKETFGYCAALNSVLIPSGVTSIGEGAFSLSGLRTVVIPASVTEIGDSAFFYAAITDIYYGGTKTQWAKIRFGAGNEEIMSDDGYIVFHYGTAVLGRFVNGKLTATAAFAPTSHGVKLIAAHYDKTGKLLDAKVVTVNGDGDYATGFAWTDGDSYRLMLVNSATFAPLCEDWFGIAHQDVA